MPTFAQKQNQPAKPKPSMLTGSHTTMAEGDLLDNPLTPRFDWNIGRISIHPIAKPAIQTKLTINQPGDIYEEEADHVADQVMSMAVPASSREIKSAASGLQRTCDCGGSCSKCSKNSSDGEGQYDDPEDMHLQRRAVVAGNREPAVAPPSVSQVLRSPGQPLDTTTRAFMEQRFGYDFSKVRLHSNAAAAQSTRDVNSRAFTVGHNIVVDTERTPLRTREGHRLLAHELTHVLQQTKSTASPQGLGLLQRKSLAETDSQALASVDFENRGLNIVKRAQLKAKVDRVISHPGAEVQEGRADFSRDPQHAKANLYHTHFRNDEARLSYALGYFQAGFGMDGNTPDPKAIAVALVNYEVEIQGQTADLVVHDPPTKAETQKLGKLRADRDLAEYKTYKAEVDRLREIRKREECERTVACSGYKGAATTDLYQSMIFDPAVEAGKVVYQQYALPIASVLLDMVPVGGQLKMLIEGIWGKDLITGRKLAGWERALNVVLVLLPEAKGFFSAGKEGLAKLAAGTVEANLDAEEIYRTSRALSRLSAEDVEAAKELAVGAHANEAQMKIMASVDEMAGKTPAKATAEPMVEVPEKAPAKSEHPAPESKGTKTAPVKAAALDLTKVKPGEIKLAGNTHKLTLKRVGNKITVWLCSPPPCAELIARAEQVLEKVSRKHPAYAQLEALIDDARINATWIDADPALASAEAELERMRNELDSIIKAHPDIGDTAGEIAEAAHEPAADPAAPHEDTGPVTDKRGAKPPRGEEPVQDAPISQRRKPSVETWNKWLQRNLANEKERDAFRQWLKNEHEGLQVHEHIFTEEEFIEVVRRFRAEQ